MIAPAPALGGHAHHDDFVRQLQGHTDGVAVITPDGEMAIYDGSQRKGQVFEAKTGYKWLGSFHQNVIEGLLGNGPHAKFPQEFEWMREAAENSIQQHTRQTSVAKKCDLSLDWYINTKDGQVGFRRLGIKIKYIPFRH